MASAVSYSLIFLSKKIDQLFKCLLKVLDEISIGASEAL